jgi:ParB family chromosome partitioning protein
VSNDGAASGGGKRRQLGRGLSSLLGDDEDDVAQVDRLRQTRHISIEHIEPGAAQPRRAFDETELESLAESIRERGVLQPILLRRVPDGGDRMEIIAGERRWRAAQIAGLHEIPALVREFTDTEALEIALIENIQRSDLTALEEAEGFQRLIDEYGHTQEDVAKAVGKSRSHIANTLRLLSLSPKAKEHLEAGLLTAGHARALLVSEDADRLAEYVVAGGLSVRATERLVQGGAGPDARKPKSQDGAQSRPPREKDADTRALEKSVTESLGLNVDITPRDADRGTITIQYQTLDQLDDLLARLTAMVPTSFMGDDDTDGIFTSDGPMEASFLDGSLENHPLVSAGLEEAGPSDASPVSMDFNTLMAQTETLLTSGEIEEDLESEATSSSADHEQGDGPGDPESAALVSGILDALNVVDPQPEPSNAMDTNAADNMDEWEREIMSQNALGRADDDKKAPKPESATNPGNLNPDDDEIAFID